MDSVTVRRGYADGRFGQMHYRMTESDSNGSAPPLICLHQSPYSGRVFSRFIGAMGTDRVAVAPDTPGFGDSDPPPSTPGIEDYAGAIGDLVDRFGFESVDLMGYHTGSMIAVELGLQRPELVRGIVMISAPIFTPEEIPERRELFGPVVISRDGSHLADKWRSAVKWAMPGRSLESVAEQFPDAVRRPDISWWGHYAAYGYPLADRLPRIDKRLLLLNPEDDVHERTLRAEGLLANGRIHELPGWGHGFLELHADETAALVRGFLDADG
jgi:pimeloyl-ACP methyl ester carboxylesterase